MAPSSHRAHKPKGPPKSAGPVEPPAETGAAAARNDQQIAPTAPAPMRPARRKKGGDPERRKEYSIHALLRKITLASKPLASNGETPAETATTSAAPMPKENVVPPIADTASPCESNEELSLFMFDFGECDAQRCSGRRLLRHAKLNKITGTGRVQYAQREGGRSSTSIADDSEGDSGNTSGSEAESDSDSSCSGREWEGSANNTAETPSTAAPAAAADAPTSAGGTGLVRVRVKGRRFKGILLSPYFDNKTQIFSPADAMIMRQHGLAVVDCSWNRVLEGRRSQHMDFVRSKRGDHTLGSKRNRGIFYHQGVRTGISGPDPWSLSLQVCRFREYGIGLQ